LRRASIKGPLGDGAKHYLKWRLVIWEKVIGLYLLGWVDLIYMGCPILHIMDEKKFAE
jgi:hypothetical protein